jgi:hypothetical protein
VGSHSIHEGMAYQREKGRRTMGDDKDEGARMTERNKLADQLAKETGITEAQAADLIKMLGTDRNSLLREARVIYRRRLR